MDIDAMIKRAALEAFAESKSKRKRKGIHPDAKAMEFSEMVESFLELEKQTFQTGDKVVVNDLGWNFKFPKDDDYGVIVRKCLPTEISPPRQGRAYSDGDNQYIVGIIDDDGDKVLFTLPAWALKRYEAK